MSQIIVFHYPRMELTGQTKDRDHGQQQGGDKTLGKQGGLENLQHVTLQLQLLPHIHGAIENGIQAVKPQQHKGHHLDKGFETDCQHQAGLVLGGIDVTSAEQQGKDRHQRRHYQSRIDPVLGRILEDIIKRQGDGFQLQGDIGEHTDDRHQGDQHRQTTGLAVTGSKEIGDGGNMMLLGHRDHFVDQGSPQQHGENRAKVDGQVVPTVLGGFPHRPVERPGGAIDTQPQAVDPGILEGFAPLACRPVAPPGDHEQHQHITQCQATQLPQ